MAASYADIAAESAGISLNLQKVFLNVFDSKESCL
jgi:hypothetical protein